jgi:hypothetical protein
MLRVMRNTKIDLRIRLDAAKERGTVPPPAACSNW